MNLYASFIARVLRAWLALALLAGAIASRPAQAADWSPIGPQTATVLALARSPASPSVMLAGTYFGGLYASFDWGYSWKHVESPFSTYSVFAIAFHPTDPATIYVGSFEGGVFRTRDGGTTWKAINEGLADHDVQAVAIDPRNPQRLFAGTSNGGLMVSTDGGDHWAPAPGIAGTVRARTVLFSTAIPGEIFAGTIGQGVLRSLDDGKTWGTYNNGLPGTTVLTLAQGPDKSLYAATDNGAAKCVTSCTLWRDISFNLPKLPISQLMPHPVWPGMTFAATLGGVYVIGNDASDTSWMLWDFTPSRLLAADPNGFVIHVGLIHGGLNATTDFGGSWRRFDNGIQNAFVGTLATPSANGSTTVYAGTDLGVYKLSSGIAGWSTSLAKQQAIFDLQTLPSAPDTVYAGLEFSSVWKTTDAAQNWAQASKGVRPADVFTLARSEAATELVYAGTSSGLYVSRDGGKQWGATTNVTLPLVLSVAADPTRRPFVYVGSVGGQVMRSADEAYSFWPANKGLPAQDILRLHSAAWEKTYAVTGGGKLYATSDDGQNWFPVATGVADRIVDIASERQRGWVLYLATAGGGVYKSESAGLNWAKVNTGIDSPHVFAIKVDATDPKKLWAAGSGKVWRSSDSGATWTGSTAGLPANTAITAVEPDRKTAGTLYASVQGKGVYRSVDGGVNWAAINGSLPVAAVAGNVAISSGGTAAGELLAGLHLEGIWRTANAGAAWSLSDSGLDLFVRSVAIDPRAPATLYAGTINAGVFRSDDSGANWKSLGLRDRTVFKVTLDPSDSKRVYAATSRGVTRSIDGGASWVTLGQQAAYLYSMATDPADAGKLMVGTLAGQVWGSSDAGASWAGGGSSLPQANILALLRLPAKNGVAGDWLAAPERSGIWRSSDGGASWSKVSSGAIDSQQVTALSVDARSGLLYASTNGGGIFLSPDNGGYWVEWNTGLAVGGTAAKVVGQVLPSPSTDWKVYAATKDQGLFVSTDAGTNWKPLGSGLPKQVNRILALPGNVLIAGTATGLYRSTNDGTAWAAVGPAGASVATLASLATTPTRLLAGTTAGAILVSSDGGATWIAATRAGTRISPVSEILPGAGTTAYAGTLGGGFLKSTDSGASWSEALDPTTIAPVATVVRVDPGDPKIIYAGTGGQGIIRSKDGGATWAFANQGLSTLSLLAMVIDPSAPKTVYAGTTGGGVFVSTNGGDTWTALNSGLFNKNITSLSLDGANPKIIYAGTEGGGVFRLER